MSDVYVPKKRHFFIQERFNKLIYVIYTIIKCGTWQPVKLMLSTLIQRYDKATLIQKCDTKPFHFNPVKKRETNSNLQAVRCHIL